MARVRARTRCALAACVAALLLAACTGEGGPDVPTTAPPSDAATRAVTPSASPSPSPSPAELGIEFKYQEPDPPCPPVSALPTLAAAEQHRYTSDPFVANLGEPDDPARNFYVSCVYQPAAMADEDVVIAEDHIRLWIQLSLHHTWNQRIWPASTEEPPLASDHIDDWRRAMTYLLWDRGVWREGCGAELTSCAEGERPAVQTREWNSNLDGHIGNLHIDLNSKYIAVDLPPSAERTIINLYREFLLAIVDTWEHAD